MLLINPYVGAINTGINNYLSSMNTANKILLGAILGGMMLSKLYHGEKDKDMRLFKVDRFDN